MELKDINRAQEELFEASQEYFDNWYEREEEFRKKFTEEDDD